VDRAKVFGGGLRGLLSAGSWAHLMRWCKQADNRHIEASLTYINEEASWRLALREGTNDIFRGEASSLESLTLQAVAALGK